jgi:maltose alpha-D-glucosyltransferase/alpha-amylase
LWALADRLLADPLLPPDGHHLVARAVDAVGTDTGAAIRVHGDLHLGQTLLGGDGWMLLDFEGEPDRPVAERRVHASPLRDVAGMLRSLAYAVAAHERSGGAPLAPGWEPAARAALLDGYLAAVDPALLPGSAASVDQLLALLELEKVLYEVAYERAHRPDWEAIPLAGLDRLVAHGRRTLRGPS